MTSDSRAEYRPVIILGAGPAGLSVSYELARRGIEALIVEKGPVAGNSFANFPRNIFFGPWLNNLLPGSRVSWSWLLRRSTQPAYAWYLAEFARQNQLQMALNTTVEGVHQEDGRFVLTTSKGCFWSKIVINATGYFSAPYIPSYPGVSEALANRTAIHVSQYRDADTVRSILGRSNGRVLVVGKRLSAGETMCELTRQGFDVGLSYRGQLEFGPSQWREAFWAPLNWIKEQVANQLRLKFNSYPLMAGGESQRLIGSGQVKTYPNIARIEGKRVTFEDGQQQEYDLLIFATGYHAAVAHLQQLFKQHPGSEITNPDGSTQPRLQGMESATVPGLFFLGLDNQRTFRSRFLRGITQDAKIAADLVARRLATLNPWPNQQRVIVPTEVLIDLDESPECVQDHQDAAISSSRK